MPLSIPPRRPVCSEPQPALPAQEASVVSVQALQVSLLPKPQASEQPVSLLQVAVPTEPASPRRPVSPPAS